MRFIAAALVFFFHSFAVYPLTSQFAMANVDLLVGPAGYISVTFFFVLSGFVLTWAARSSDTTLAFWRRRFFKIYPTHLLTFLVAVLLVAVVSGTALVNAGETDNNGFSALLNVFLLQSWNHRLGIGSSWNGVAWSLSCEVLFYACFPFIIRLINKIRPERLWLWTILSAISVVSLPSFAKLLPTTLMFPQGYSDWQLWFVFHSPPTALLTFVFGMLMAKVVLAGRRLPLNIGGAIALAVFAYFACQVFPALYVFSAVTLIPLGLLVAAGAAADNAGQRTFLSSRLMVWLGNISFAFYMWHFLVLVYGHYWLGAGTHWGTWTAIGVMFVLFAVSLVLSWASFTFFERPIMKWFATSRRRRDLAAAGTTPTGDLEQVSASSEAPSLVTIGETTAVITTDAA
jgi:peptidoglycan/LPS O-acetylase OafA/YrhL